MAKFKILNSKVVVNSFGSDGRCELEVELIEGTPKTGDRFQLWETHHNIDFTIVGVEIAESTGIVHASPHLARDGWNAGTVVDTEDPEESRKCRFGGTGRFLYHPDTLNAAGFGDDCKPLEG